MKNSDRTYIQALGFQDEDKADSLHDKACVYLTMPARLSKIVQMSLSEGDKVTRGPTARLSYPLVEVTGYQDALKRTVGYADVLVRFTSEKYREHGIVFEVKSKERNLPKIIQQLETYRRGRYIQPGVCGADFWLATLYKISATEKELIRSHGFTHIYLDPETVQREYTAFIGKPEDEAGF